MGGPFRVAWLLLWGNSNRLLWLAVPSMAASNRVIQGRVTNIIAPMFFYKFVRRLDERDCLSSI